MVSVTTEALVQIRKDGETAGAEDMRERAAKLAMRYIRQGNVGDLPEAIRALRLSDD